MRDAEAAADLPYRLELWDAGELHVEQLVALIGNGIVARAAFDAAVRQYPGKILMLRDGARIVRRQRPEPAPPVSS